MGRYVKGTYKSVANENNFYDLISLKDKIEMIAGLEQNDMIVTEEDLEYCTKLVELVNSKLSYWLENKLTSLEYLGCKDDECG